MPDPTVFCLNSSPKDQPHLLYSAIAFSVVFLVASAVSPLAYSAPAKHSAKPVTKQAHKRSATRPTHRLLMKTALQAAIQKNPLNSVTAAHHEVADAYHDQANAVFAGDPSYNISYMSDGLNSNRGFREVESSLDFPLWRSGQKQARHQLANSIVSKAKAEQSLLAWEISGVVLERAWALRIAQMEVEQAGVQLHSAKKLEADVKRRVQAGEIARADLLLAQQNTATANMLVQQAQAGVITARDAWKAYTGFTQLPVDLIKQSQVKHLPHEKHPHIVASKARVTAAQAARSDVRKQRRDNSTLSFYAKRDRGADVDPYNNALGVGVSIPFGTKTSSAPRLAEANAEVVVLIAEEEKREREHSLEISQAKLRVSHAQKTLVLAKQQNSLAQRRWKLSRRAFDLGESNLFELIRARERADIQARTIKRNQLELSLSQARLNHILGAMPL